VVWNQQVAGVGEEEALWSEDVSFSHQNNRIFQGYWLQFMLTFFAGVCEKREEGGTAYHIHREYRRSRLDVC